MLPTWLESVESSSVEAESNGHASFMNIVLLEQVALEWTVLLRVAINKVLTIFKINIYNLARKDLAQAD